MKRKFKIGDRASVTTNQPMFADLGKGEEVKIVGYSGLGNCIVEEKNPTSSGIWYVPEEMLDHVQVPK